MKADALLSGLYLDFKSNACFSNKKFIRPASVYSLHVNHLCEVVVSLFFHLQDAEMPPLKFLAFSIIAVEQISQ